MENNSSLSYASILNIEIFYYTVWKESLLLPLVSQKKSLGIGKLAYNGGIKAQILSQGKNT